MTSSIINFPSGSKGPQTAAVLQSSVSIEVQSSPRFFNNHNHSSNNNNNISNTGGIQSSARNSQGSKSKHRNHRKPSIQRDEFIAEAIAMTSSTASRKGRTSITHLMDWSLPPPRIPHHHNSRTYGSRRTPSWGAGSGYHAIDKARYVNANYRFIVDPAGDYRSQSLDPDSPLPWTSVLQILASSLTQSPSCPICLCDPVAPRMARCGHIFCLPCLIRYMASEDDNTPKGSQQQQINNNNNKEKQKWKKCPICHDSVYMNEVRAVRFFTGQEKAAPREGEDVMLRLMVRHPGSTLALPRDVANNTLPLVKKRRGSGSVTDTEGIPWHYAAEAADYARIMKGTRGYLVGEYEREIAELEEQERHDEVMFGDETDWVRKAIGKVKSAIEKAAELPEKGEEKAGKVLGRELYERYLREEAEARAEESRGKGEIKMQTEVEVPEMYTATSSGAQNGVETASPLDIKKEEAETPQRSPTRSRSKQQHVDGHDPSQPYYFYQTLPHSYLSPLDIRILKIAFGSFAAFPSSVLPRVENFSMGHVVDDELRRRAKYLSHLPYGCEVAFLECDWTDIVPAEVLDKFEADLERRRKKKREKDTREERDRVRAEREEDAKRWSGARRASGNGRIDPTDEVGLAMEISRREYEAVVEEEEDEGMVGSGPRFGFGSLPQSSPPNTRTVWGTPIVTGGEEVKQYAKVVEERKDTGWLEGWERDIIAADQQALQSPSGGGGKGKKKFKKVTLMTNTGKRGA